ncbi:alpha/beta-hydrolase family protein [Nocardia carnea]|uniref:alpha/beta-hydrolase family protein n=1 Tax=Nocardia carnea TaxID=37328 RepID=UPI0024543EBC|nr:alpha/beta-hydrolase family protein [Nocardia carnea]
MTTASTPGSPIRSAPSAFELLVPSRTHTTPAGRQATFAIACPRFRYPPVGITVAVTLGSLLSLAPGLLPRSAATQAVLTSILVLALLALAGLGRLSHRPRSRRGNPATTTRTRAPADGLGTATGDTATRKRRRHVVTAHSGGDDPARRAPHRGSGPYIRSTCPGSPPAADLPRTAPRCAGSTTAPGNQAVDRPGTAGRSGTRTADRPRRPGVPGSPATATAGSRTPSPTSSALPRKVALTVAVAGVLVAVVHAAAWQNSLRDAMGVARTGPEYWPLWAAGSVVLTAALVAAGSAIGRVLRRVGWSRGLVMAVVAGLPIALLGGPGIAGVSGQTIDPGLVRPAAVTRSGSADSLVSWSSLGREGQRFVTTGPPGAVRVYVGLRSAPDLAARAALAVRELDRAGGFDRSHLVVAVPTGSGWVDARALQGFGERFGGDVAVVALQYSNLPSWATFVLGRGSAAASARAVFTAIEDHAATLPDPPRLHLYGQSLGALGGSAVFAGAAEQNRRVCSVLWAGRPGGGGPEPGARTAVLANISDPVVHWSPDLLWRPPDLTGIRRDAPAPGWLPVVSFVQTTADLLGALGAPPGHGHRYGIDQGTAMPGCG